MEAPPTDLPANPRRIPLWPLMFCVLPVVIAMVLLLLVNQPKPPANSPANAPARTSSAADLGSHSTPLQPPARAPQDEPLGGGTNAATDPEAEPDKPQPPPETIATEREIDIHIQNLKFAVQRNNGQGRNLETGWLRAAKPRELVLRRLENAAASETDGAVRLSQFNCLLPEETPAQIAWVQRSYTQWRARFLGTDTALAYGEIDEFSVYVALMLTAPELTVLALELAQNALNSEKPLWVLEVLAHNLPWGPKCSRDLAVQLRAELGLMIARQTLEVSIRDRLTVAWAWQFDSVDALLQAAAAPKMERCLAALLSSNMISEDCFSAPDVAKLLRRVDEILQSQADVKLKQLYINALAGLAGGRARDAIRAMVEAGMTRRDANLADFLCAFGRLAPSTKDLDLLSAFANDADANVARGAINGLRQSSALAADDKLRDLLLHGTNSGVKGDALAALLARNPDTRDALVNEYLAEDKPASLRAIAVAYLPEKNLEKLKALGENDPELRVREAAIHRLGLLKDKTLKTWFMRISRSDNSPLLRQLAKKYQAELD